MAVHVAISASARGERRVWKQTEAKQFAAVLALFKDRDVRRAAKEFSKKYGRHMAASFVLRKFDAVARPEVRDLDGRAPFLCWSVVQPSKESPLRDTDEHTLTADERQACSSVFYVATEAHALLMRGLWSLSITDHAVARLIDRCPGAGITATIMAGHDALLGMADRHVEPIMKAGGDLLVPTNCGAWLCHLALLKAADTGRWVLHARAGTFIDTDRLRPQQIEQMAQLMAPRAGDRPLAKSLLHPFSLRGLG